MGGSGQWNVAGRMIICPPGKLKCHSEEPVVK